MNLKIGFLLNNTDYISRGRSGSLFFYPKKLWWSLWYFPNDIADGNPIGILHMIAIALLTVRLEWPAQCVKSWINTCNVWFKVPPTIYKTDKYTGHEQSFTK